MIAIPYFFAPVTVIFFTCTVCIWMSDPQKYLELVLLFSFSLSLSLGWYLSGFICVVSTAVFFCMSYVTIFNYNAEIENFRVHLYQKRHFLSAFFSDPFSLVVVHSDWSAMLECTPCSSRVPTNT